MITAKERLLQFLEYIKMGQNAFERKVKIANGYISHNKGSIGSSVIGKIAIAYPELNTSWLLTGEGNMLRYGFEREPESTKTPTQLELDFSAIVASNSKIADACQRTAAAVEDSAKTGRILAESNSCLVESNAKLMDQLLESLTRIEKKIDDREGAMPESGDMLQARRPKE